MELSDTTCTSGDSILFLCFLLTTGGAEKLVGVDSCDWLLPGNGELGVGGVLLCGVLGVTTSGSCTFRRLGL